MSGSEPPPPGPKGPRTTHPAVATSLGVLAGIVLSAAVSYGNFMLGMGFPLGGVHPDNCGLSRVAGVVEVLIALGLAFLAWKAMRRDQSTSGARFTTALTVVAALFFLLPWPCSFTGAAYALFMGCR